MTKFLFAFILVFSHHVFAQESFLDQKIELDITYLDSEEFLNKLYFFVGKDFDSVDIQLLATGPTIGTLLVQVASEKKEPTYGDLYELLLTLKSEGGETYQQVKSYYIILSALKLQPATLDNWNEMKRVFLEVGSNPEDMILIDELMAENLDSTMNLSEVLGVVTLIIDEENSEYEVEIMDDFHALFTDEEAIDIEKSKQLAAEADLPLLIYFTGYNCVNCRKLEESVLKDPEIAGSLLNDFIVVAVYIDSQKELSAELKGKFTIDGREYDIETVGDYNRYFQLSEFKILSQPFIVFMTPHGEILGTADYQNNNTVQSMKKVMEDVLEKFY